MRRKSDVGQTNVLRLRTVRNTRGRRLVLEVFARTSGHVTLDDLVAAARAQNPSIGHSTVYRTVKLMLIEGIAAERRFEGHATRYELVDLGHHHDHMICRACGEIVEFEDERLEELQRDVAARYGYLLHAHRHELYGICGPCLVIERRGGRGSPQ